MTDRCPTAAVPDPKSLAPHPRLTHADASAVAPEKATPSASDAASCLDSASLLRGNSSVAITHRGAVYRLQATRQGKLILTK